MDNEPLSPTALRRVAAQKAWESLGERGPIPRSFYDAVDIVIKEAYMNVDKMVGKTIKQRLESIYNNE